MISHDDFSFWLDYRISLLGAMLEGKLYCPAHFADRVTEELAEVLEVKRVALNLSDAERAERFSLLSARDRDNRPALSLADVDALHERLMATYKDEKVNGILRDVMRKVDHTHCQVMRSDLRRFGYVRPFVRDMRGWLLENELMRTYYMEKRLYYAGLPLEEHNSQVTWACRMFAEEAIYRALAMERQGYVESDSYIQNLEVNPG